MIPIIIDGDIRIPDWIADLESFRRWCHSDEFPPTGRIDYLQGEVWVDTGGERLSFDIFRLTDEGYVATRKRGSWLKSEVFGKSFRLTRQVDRFDNPEYTLEVR